MRFEGSRILIELVEQNLRVVVAWYQDFELQSARFISKATGSMRHEQCQHLLSATWQNFNGSDDGQLGHGAALSIFYRANGKWLNKAMFYGKQRITHFPRWAYQCRPGRPGLPRAPSLSAE